MVFKEYRAVLPIAGGILYLAIHAAALSLYPGSADGIGLAFNNISVLLALAVCCWKAKHTAGSRLLLWVLLCIGLGLWSIGMLLSAWEVLVTNAAVQWAQISDFFFFLYGVPVLLAISVPMEDQDLLLFLALDGVQMLLAASLSYIVIFSVVPFTAEVQPLSEAHLAAVYNVENLLLAAAASAHLVARSDSREERGFFRILCWFLWLYAVCAGIYNFLTVRFQLTPASMIALTVDIPFVFLVVSAARPVGIAGSAVFAGRSTLAQWIENLSPILYTSGLLVLGTTVASTHFYIGTISILVGLLVYGIRTTILRSQLERSRGELQRANERLEEISLLDGLTNVANRRSFDRMLELEWNRTARAEGSLALMMVDVDYFKAINDRYGHRYGDVCLIEVADALRTNLPRSGDFLARYGGEEFAVLLPGTGLENAERVAERLREAVFALDIQNEGSEWKMISVSIGVAASRCSTDDQLERLAEAADKALYCAKKSGRNRVECFTDAMLLQAGDVADSV